MGRAPQAILLDCHATGIYILSLWLLNHPSLLANIGVLSERRLKVRHREGIRSMESSGFTGQTSELSRPDEVSFWALLEISSWVQVQIPLLPSGFREVRFVDSGSKSP